MLDGEDPGADTAEVERHLAGCAECRAWRDTAHEVTRRVRLAAVPPVPRRVREAAAAARASADRRHGWRRWKSRQVVLLRTGLAAVAAGQAAITVPYLLFGADRMAPVHIAHEMGSLDAALAVGFAAAAWRPGRALGMRMLVGAAAVLLAVTALADLAAGRTTVADEAPHLLPVAGWLMIRRLAVLTPPAVVEPAPGRLAHTIRVRLRVPGWLGRWLSAARVYPGGVPAARAPVTVTSFPATALFGEAGTECGCAAAACSCPGCARPRRAAGG
jgi:predicted anti-sigma-YlaC factor YlaD